MKKLLLMFFAALGVLFVALIIVGLYFYIADPLELRPLLSGNSQPVASQGVAASESEAAVQDSHPMLSDTQEKALETFGIDPATIPSSISPEQEQCFIDAIGAARVEAIKAGDSPTATEIFKARGCL